MNEYLAIAGVVGFCVRIYPVRSSEVMTIDKATDPVPANVDILLMPARKVI